MEDASELDRQTATGAHAYWARRRVFLTGATGLVGSWVLERLLAAQADVVCLRRDFVPNARVIRQGLLDKTTVVHGEVEDYSLLVRVLNEYEIHTVIHLAAQTIVRTANRSPLSTFESNIAGTWNLLEACRVTPSVRSVTVASSDKAYGEVEMLPYDESFALAGRHPYDVSKSCSDLIAQSYHATYELPVSITRCGNFFGPGDLNFDRIVPGTIRSVLFNERPIIRSDGAPRRDYVYVEDAADAYLLLAERTATDPHIAGEAFNFSYEQPLSVHEVVEAVLAAAGRPDLDPIVLSNAPNEIGSQYLNATKAKRMLGWAPEHDLASGLPLTVEWYRQLLGASAFDTTSSVRV